MDSKYLPSLHEAKNYYDIEFDKYAVAMFHPVTTEFSNVRCHIKNFIDALIESDKNYILIYPNNDLGSVEILKEYGRLEGNSKIKVSPSLRFEYFLKLLKNANFMIGNSSAGIREAPHYQVPSVNIGTRQNNRVTLDSVVHCSYNKNSILNAVQKMNGFNVRNEIQEFGQGNSDKLFFKLLRKNSFWRIKCQKQFQEYNNK
jgi:UDP-N-acetylglucosamine 2-epimerase (hydrolysing)